MTSKPRPQRPCTSFLRDPPLRGQVVAKPWEHPRGLRGGAQGAGLPEASPAASAPPPLPLAPGLAYSARVEAADDRAPAGVFQPPQERVSPRGACSWAPGRRGEKGSDLSCRGLG